jgi:hypothetical protein
MNSPCPPSTTSTCLSVCDKGIAKHGVAELGILQFPQPAVAAAAEALHTLCSEQDDAVGSGGQGGVIGRLGDARFGHQVLMTEHRVIQVQPLQHLRPCMHAMYKIYKCIYKDKYINISVWVMTCIWVEYVTVRALAGNMAYSQKG